MEDQNPLDSAPIENAEAGDDAAFAALLAGEQEAPADEATPFEGAPDDADEGEAPDAELDAGAEVPLPDPDEIRQQYEAQLQQLQERTQYLEQERQQREFQRQQQQREQAEWAWRQAEEQEKVAARQEAERLGLDFENAIVHVQNRMGAFYNQRDQALRQVAQQMIEQQNIAGYREHLTQQYGLSAEDAMMLGNDTSRMHLIAERIASQRTQVQSELETMRKELDQLKRAQKAQKRMASGVDRTGGGQGRPLPKDWNDIPLRDLTAAVFTKR